MRTIRLQYSISIPNILFFLVMILCLTSAVYGASPVQPSLLTVSSDPVSGAVATPAFSTNGGAFTSPVTLTMQTATSGASIHYTVDGSTPTQLSTSYTSTITISKSATIRAKAFKAGYSASPEAVASFTIGSLIGGSNLVGYWKFDEGTGTSATDSSGSGNKGTLINGPQWTAGIDGNALFFDGIDDSVTVFASNSLELSNSFTLSVWVNPATAFSDFRSILVKNYRYYLYSSVSGYCGDGSPLGGFSELSDNTVCQPMPLPINAWTHLSLTYNGSKLTLYRNGVAVSSSAASATLSPTMGTLQIGASQYGENFHGLIDEVRVYNSALTQTEIEAIYKETAIKLPFNYSIIHSGDRSVNAGGSVTNNLTIDLLSGVAQPVSLSVSGLPSGTTGSLSRTSCTPICSTVITIITTGATTAGSYPITVTATSGALKRSSTFTLSVSLALAIVTPVTSATVTGKTYYVATNGNDSHSCSQAQNISTARRSIQGGLNCLAAGDTLVLTAGTYSKPLNQAPSGTSWTNATKIVRHGSDRVTVQGWPGFYSSNVQYIVLDGLIVDAGGSASDEAIMIGNGAHHIRIINSELLNGRRQGVLIDKTSGHNEIINNAIHDNGTIQIYDHGVYIEGYNNLVDGCRIYNNAAYGVHLYSGYGQTSNNNVVRNNSIFANGRLGSWPTAMVIRSGRGALVYNNIIRDNPNGGIQVGSGAIDATIVNNTIYKNSGAAIYVYPGSTGTIIKNNILFQNSGAVISEVTDTVTSNNLTTNPMFKNPAGGDFSLQTGSPAIDAGTTVADVPFDFNYNPRPKGGAYDIGAIEY